MHFSLIICSYLLMNSLLSFSLMIWLLTLIKVSTVSCHPIPLLIVISFDGFRNDYINNSLTPNLYKLAENGVKGQYK
jgi:predicted AlkP superfamily pyrophosphatase or phosphodiesterase